MLSFSNSPTVIVSSDIFNFTTSHTGQFNMCVDQCWSKHPAPSCYVILEPSLDSSFLALMSF